MKPSHTTYRSRELESLQRLHSTVQRTSPNLRNAVDLSNDYGDDWRKVSATIIRQERAARMDVPVECGELKSDANSKCDNSDSLQDGAIVGTADSRDPQLIRTEAGREMGSADELSDVDANMIDLFASKAMPGQTKLLTKNLEQPPDLAEPANKENTPIIIPPFATDNAKPKRKTESTELQEFPTKKPRTGNALESPAKDHTQPTTVSKEDLNKKSEDVGAGEGKGSSIEGIDAWILREFGKYVNFV